MEHINDLENAYKIMYNLLKTGGFISHQIDYRAHETHKVWNGHWRYSDLLWQIIMHGRSYPINRKVHSEHISSIKNAGFQVINEIKVQNLMGYSRKKINKKFRKFSDEDLKTSSAHIIAIKL